ncbi:oleate hydratase [Paenibacillus dendritiformis]|uniref:oleate hydratase n=1 Tax=Paenibacillus dendritiformis TaxID=130049 RepID=UPI0018CE5E89|nr:oleate hydratase [Paenibacillus dendritiformis]MBG9793277.1 oleate hydratase [Paenibacillus dendritiformis]
MSTEYNNKQVYFVGGGIASLAGAAFLVRDCDFPGFRIHILEEMKILGGSNDGSGNGEQGYVIRGGRMLNDETYENTWDLLSSIPSIDDPAKSVREEIVEFDTAHPTHSNARLVNKRGEVQDVTSMGFDMADRIAMSKLIMTPEEKLGTARIRDWFGPHFFETNFWYMWATTFAFQPWHSVAELKRYMIRFMHEFPRIHTLEGVTRTPYNQYDSLTVPLHNYLAQHGVDFNMKCTVTDLDFKEGSGITVTKIHYVREGAPGTIELHEGDLVIVTNGSMTEGYSLGSMTAAPSLNGKGSSWKLWDRIAAKKPGLGNPSTFDEPEHVRVFWGYGLFPDNVGDDVKKKMSDCTGEEILTELLNHLHFHEDMEAIIKTANCIPCMMPYITAQFMPRSIGDRPQVVPHGSTNLAFVGQFCEIPDDVVFTEEYSVRSARIAVYTLLGMNKPIAPINEYQYDIRTLLNGLVTSFR